MSRVSNRIEGAQRPFGCERSEQSCPGPGSAEQSAAEHGPNSSFFIGGNILPLIEVHMWTSRFLEFLENNLIGSFKNPWSITRKMLECFTFL